MKRITRVRWTADERAAVIRRAQTLLADDPRITSARLFDASQEGLAKERQRPGNPNARAWLREEVKRAGPLPSPATVWRPEPQAGDQAQPPKGDDRDEEAPATKSGAGAHEGQPPLVSALIEAGIQVITGILADPRVRAALVGLAQGGAAGEPAATLAPVDDAAGPSAERRELVVVAGCSAEEARSLEKELDGMMDVTFWASDEPRERLLGLLPRAELVIGVAGGLPQAVESSLARLGQRYVRHNGGMPALYRRLAERALR